MNSMQTHSVPIQRQYVSQTQPQQSSTIPVVRVSQSLDTNMIFSMMLPMMMIALMAKMMGSAVGSEKKASKTSPKEKKPSKSTA